MAISDELASLEAELESYQHGAIAGKYKGQYWQDITLQRMADIEADITAHKGPKHDGEDITLQRIAEVTADIAALRRRAESG